jgi:hypothetical protein
MTRPFFSCQTQVLFGLIIRARMPVPKLAKNGQNSSFAFESKNAPARNTETLEIQTALKAQRGIKTIFGQI